MNIVVNNLCKSYGSLKVLKSYSTVIEEGKTSCIMGASGCGKTTFLRILMGLEPYDSGTIDGINGKKLSTVFQEDRLCENISAIANVQLICKGSTPVEEIEENLEKLLPKDCITKPISELSGGMKRRAAIVRAVMAEYDILLLDEPFKGLDNATKKLAADYILKNAIGKTVLLVTHNADEAKMLKAEIISFN